MAPIGIEAKSKISLIRRHPLKSLLCVCILKRQVAACSQICLWVVRSSYFF